ncbi:MAG: metallophosphoesterase family protein [Longimicrobiales bacterium]
MNDGREVRLAAVGDLHFDGASRGALVDLFAAASRAADILVLAGDLTTHGKPEQARGLLEELAGVETPIVTVLGNHDHESGQEDEVKQVLVDAGIHVLDGDHVVVEGIGFAGCKGFAGGFGRGALAPFGERLIKEFVQEAIEESLRLENALRGLNTQTRVVVLHYAPIVDTVLGEPETIYPFLGSSRLLQPIDTIGADVVFHGHAHHGALEATTPQGIPVYNVSLALLRQHQQAFRVWTAAAPDRRRRGAVAAAEHASSEGETHR